MATRDFSQYFLYRQRYVIGYSLIGILLVAMLVFAGLYLPGGLSQQEMATVVQSSAITINNPSTLAIADLPYHLLQSAILSIFGINTFTIKLASLILALITAVGLIYLLRRWFRENIAVLASLIAITTGQFLYIAQSGTPSVMYILWPTLLLLLGTQVTRVQRFRFGWKVLFGAALALSLYTPLSIYPAIAILFVTIFHPHLRAIMRRLRRNRVIIVSGVFMALVAPLVWLVSLSPQLALTLLGVPSHWPPDFNAHIAQLIEQYGLFWKPSSTELMTPAFGLGSAILIAMGAYRLVKTRQTTRSYLLIFWILCLIIVLLINPNYTSVTFVPAVMMLAAGLTSLISYWYRLFPFNPYARIAGLIPIIILVGALISTGFLRYMNGYHYSTSIAPLFSTDLALLPEKTPQLVVSNEEFPFYEAVAQYRGDLSVVKTPTESTIIVTKAARDTITNFTVTKIITNDRSHESDRLYVMQRQQ